MQACLKQQWGKDGIVELSRFARLQGRGGGRHVPPHPQRPPRWRWPRQTATSKSLRHDDVAPVASSDMVADFPYSGALHGFAGVGALFFEGMSKEAVARLRACSGRELQRWAGT
jgi:hypothetical protein